jgi:hypothetical protein
MENSFALLVTSNAKSVNLHLTTVKNVPVLIDKTHQNVTVQMATLTHVAQIATSTQQVLALKDTDQ